MLNAAKPTSLDLYYMILKICYLLFALEPVELLSDAGLPILVFLLADGSFIIDL